MIIHKGKSEFDIFHQKHIWREAAIQRQQDKAIQMLLQISQWSHNLLPTKWLKHCNSHQNLLKLLATRTFQKKSAKLWRDWTKPHFRSFYPGFNVHLQWTSLYSKEMQVHFLHFSLSPSSSPFHPLSSSHRLPQLGHDCGPVCALFDVVLEVNTHSKHLAQLLNREHLNVS